MAEFKPGSGQLYLCMLSLLSSSQWEFQSDGMRHWAQVPSSLWGRHKWEKRFYARLSLDPKVLSSPHPFWRTGFLSSFLLQRTRHDVSWNTSPQAAKIRLHNSLGSSKLLAVHLAPGWFASLQDLNSGQLLYLSRGPPVPETAEALRIGVH